MTKTQTNTSKVALFFCLSVSVPPSGDSALLWVVWPKNTDSSHIFPNFLHFWIKILGKRGLEKRRPTVSILLILCVTCSAKVHRVLSS